MLRPRGARDGPIRSRLGAAYVRRERGGVRLHAAASKSLARRDDARFGWVLRRWTTGVALVPTPQRRARTAHRPRRYATEPPPVHRRPRGRGGPRRAAEAAHLAHPEHVRGAGQLLRGGLDVPAAAPNSPASDDASPRTIHVVAAASPRPASMDYPRPSHGLSTSPPRRRRDASPLYHPRGVAPPPRTIPTGISKFRGRTRPTTAPVCVRPSTPS